MAGAARIAAAAVVLAGLAMPALGGEACDGSLQGSRLQSVPDPLTVTVEYPRKTAKAMAAAASFSDGVKAAGVSVVPDGTTTLRLTFLVTAATGAVPVQQFSDFSWAETTASADEPPPTLTVTVGLLSHGLATLLWVASVECKVKTRDANLLARELGQVVGESLGQDVSQKTF